MLVKRVRIPLRLTILTMFSALMVGIVGAVSYSNYAHGTNSSLRTARELIHQSQLSASENTERLFGITSTIANTVARIPSDLLLLNDPFLFGRFLRETIEDIPEVYSAYIAFADGQFVQALNFRGPSGVIRHPPGVPNAATSAIRLIAAVTNNNEARAQLWVYYDSEGRPLAFTQPDAKTDYDARLRPWYSRAVHEQDIGASDPYVFQSLQEPGITISSPMRHMENGVIGIDIPLDSLAEFMADQRPGPNGQVMIVAGNGQLIAHPDPEKILKRSEDGRFIRVNVLSELQDARDIVAASLLGRGDRLEETVDISGSRYIVSVSPVEAVAGELWYVVSYTSINDFTGPLHESLNRSGLIASVLLICALVLVYVVSSWIANPLSTASEFASKISRLEVDADVPRWSPFSEIQSLGQSMRAMRDAIGMFLRYAPRDLVHMLVRSGEKAEIGGKRREIAVLFTDIENFTAITENEEPEDILVQTSLYFEEMTKVLSENNAIIDKFIGDAIMALWNTPVRDDDYIEHACMASLLALQVSERLNKESAAEKLPIFITRLGLHAGEALVGNVGASERMQYTALGPTVNLASRIEGLNKIYGTSLLVTGNVQSKASERFVFKKIDVVEATGTSRPVEIYELLGITDPSSPLYVTRDAIEKKAMYEEALETYLKGDFENALLQWDDVLRENPTDSAALVLAERCNRFWANPPEGWDGVYCYDFK